MPFGAIELTPGVNTTATPTLNKAGISDSNLIRFRDGLPEKLGGWQRFVSSAMGSITRALHAWQDLNSNQWLGVGSESSLKVITSGAIQDITPQSKTTNPSIDIDTTAGSYTITIADTSILNVTQYDSVFFNTPISVGGIILSGMYQIIGGSGTGYTIESASLPTSTVVSGGSVPSFATTASSSTVVVTFANHGLSDGDRFNFPIATVVNGITISGLYFVSSVTSSTFNITGANVASATGSASMNGGLAEYLYHIAVGPSVSASYGALGPIGQFAIGEGYSYVSTQSNQTGTAITASDWTLDTWGEIFLACAKGGPIYYWQPNSGFQTAVPIGAGPPQNNGIFVSMPQQILVAWGSASSMTSANTNSAIDPLIVRWSDSLNFSEWRASTQTQAGSFHIPSGSKIVGGIQAAKAGIIFTDVDVWSMNYIGYPLVFGFDQISAGNGLVGAHAVAAMRGVVYWQTNSGFCMSSGNGVNQIRCPVWDDIFQDLDVANVSKCCAGVNIDFNEVFFFYPSTSGGTGENDKYAKLNVVDGTWDLGSMRRSAWAGRSVLGPSIGADPTTQYLQQHEMGYDADGSAMDSYYESGYSVIGDGENFGIVDHFIPDMKFATLNSTTSASLTVTMTATDYPSGGSTTQNVLTMTSTTQYLSPRLRGRQLKWRVESTDLNSWWRQGNIRYRWAPGGRR